MDRVRKDIIALFKSEGFSITIDTNLIETDFLDVSFNLEMEKLSPYRKPNNTPFHIYSESTDPSSITKQLQPTVVFQICHTMKINSTRINHSMNKI